MSSRVKTFVLLVTVAGSISVAWSQSAQHLNQLLWNVGKEQLFLSCSGQRHGEVVILEAGRGRTSADWSKVQSQVARFTEVCSYDRAGLGHSRPRAAQIPPDDPTQSVEDLHQLLTLASIRPPYVLVGHSLGGLLVRWYQSKYPDEVKGLVLLDPLHEEALSHASKFDGQAAHDLSLDPADLRRSGRLPPGEHLTWHCDIPLIVLRHGIPINFPPPMNAIQPQYEALYIALDRDLASRSPYGQLRVAEHSGHFIQIDQPQLVTDAIHDVWTAAKDHAK